jgi:hypothetical protein
MRLWNWTLIASAVMAAASSNAQEKSPTVEAGQARYTESAPVVLRGGASGWTGEIVFAWNQVAGPEVRIDEADSPSAIISGFKASGEEHRCTFELTVSDGEDRSVSDTVDVIVFPASNKNRMRFESGAFDPRKSTFVYFGGGDCVTSHEGTEAWNGGSAWHDLANVISFYYYESDQGYKGSDDIDFEKVMNQERTYFACANLLLAYLSRVAPDYAQPIQTAGFSTGGQPAMDVALRLNAQIGDARYCVPRVTFFDVYCRDYEENIRAFLASGETNEQRWIDNYVSTRFNQEFTRYYSNVLNVEMAGELAGDHDAPPVWYANSLTMEPMRNFNDGVVGGAIWSIIGEGKNLQLSGKEDDQTYFFQWDGSYTQGKMELLDSKKHPGRLLEPVTLLEPREADGTDRFVLTCEASANAIAYEVLVGPSAGNVNQIISETSAPPVVTVTDLPDDARYWTVRLRDVHGTTIHADPARLPVR